MMVSPNQIHPNSSSVLRFYKRNSWSALEHSKKRHENSSVKLEVELRARFHEEVVFSPRFCTSKTGWDHLVRCELWAATVPVDQSCVFRAIFGIEQPYKYELDSLHQRCTNLELLGPLNLLPARCALSMHSNALCIVLILKLTIATVSAILIAKISRAGRLPLRETSLLMNPSDPTSQAFLLTTGKVLSAFLQREIGGEVEVNISRVAKVRTDLLHWYSANRRLLPWRGDTIEVSALPSLYKAAASDPLNIEQKLDTAIDVGGKASSTVTFVKSAYGTWISEIMLQQTRVETVIPYWLKWMDRFPDVISLANSSGANTWTLLSWPFVVRELIQAFKCFNANF